MAMSLFSRKKTNSSGDDVQVRTPTRIEPPRPTPDSLLGDYVPAKKVELDGDPLRRLIQQKCYGLIGRNPDEWRSHPEGEKIWRAACQCLEESLALVPAGRSSLNRTLSDPPLVAPVDFEVDPFYMAVHPVTNCDYQLFVDDGGYESLDLWPEEIWPHLIEFHDLTGVTGPRYWHEGRHDARRGDHPVVGISWYEACAYAAWAGLRLPSEAEWQMAASWRIKSSADLLRRFPWGDAMDCTRCNLWNSGIGTTVSVDQYPNGVAPNNVYQLIGNVWEWASSDFEILDDDGQPIVGEMPMKGVRGGAFDTYFESQATSIFRSGQIAMGRVHNIGIRCALSLDAVKLTGEGLGETT